MCRNIRVLHNFQPPATEEEVQAAALQYVRKVSGMPKPSAANQEAFDRAVAEIASVTRRLVLDELVSRGEARDREAMAQAGRERFQQREARLRAKILAESD